MGSAVGAGVCSCHVISHVMSQLICKQVFTFHVIKTIMTSVVKCVHSRAYYSLEWVPLLEQVSAQMWETAINMSVITCTLFVTRVATHMHMRRGGEQALRAAPHLNMKDSTQGQSTTHWSGHFCRSRSWSLSESMSGTSHKLTVYSSHEAPTMLRLISYWLTQLIQHDGLTRRNSPEWAVLLGQTSVQVWETVENHAMHQVIIK